MKRLKKWAIFNTFENELNLSLDKLQSLIYSYDNRLKSDLSKPYTGNKSNFGGVYVDKNSNNEEKFYVIEALAYCDVPDTNEQQTLFKNYLGVVATRIHYTINKELTFSLYANKDKHFWQYVSVFPFDEKTNINNMVDLIKNSITINGLTLEYSASNFIDALTNEGII